MQMMGVIKSLKRNKNRNYYNFITYQERLLYKTNKMNKIAFLNSFQLNK
jgi:hypothetical protein